MEKNEIKDRLFDVLNYTDNLPIQDIIVEDRNDLIIIYLTDVTVHSVPVTGKKPYKICFANGFLLFKLHIFSRNAQFSAFLTCEQ